MHGTTTTEAFSSSASHQLATRKESRTGESSGAAAKYLAEAISTFLPRLVSVGDCDDGLAAAAIRGVECRGRFGQ